MLVKILLYSCPSVVVTACPSTVKEVNQKGNCSEERVNCLHTRRQVTQHLHSPTRYDDRTLLYFSQFMFFFNNQMGMVSIGIYFFLSKYVR